MVMVILTILIMGGVTTLTILIMDTDILVTGMAMDTTTIIRTTLAEEALPMPMEYIATIDIRKHQLPQEA